MKFIYKIKQMFLTIFGDIQYSKFPMFFYYKPCGYKIKGYDTRKVIEVIKPGDIVLRKYNNYIDGKFIPGDYSHSGIYVGNNQVIHMLAEGCVCEDIIDFLRTDKICILRSKGSTKRAVQRAWKAFRNNIQYDFSFEDHGIDANLRYYCHEFTASCYKEFNIPKVSGKIFYCIKTPKKILAASFLEHPRFKKVIELPEEI